MYITYINKCIFNFLHKLITKIKTYVFISPSKALHTVHIIKLKNLIFS